MLHLKAGYDDFASAVEAYNQQRRPNYTVETAKKLLDGKISGKK